MKKIIKEVVVICLIVYCSSIYEYTQNRPDYYYSQLNEFRREYNENIDLQEEVISFIDEDNIVKNFKDNKEQMQNLVDFLFGINNKDFKSSTYSTEVYKNDREYYRYQNLPNYKSIYGQMVKNMEEYEVIKNFIDYTIDKELAYIDWMLEIRFILLKISYSGGSVGLPKYNQNEYIEIQVFSFRDLSIEYIYSPNKDISNATGKYEENNTLLDEISMERIVKIESNWYYRIKKSFTTCG